MNTPHPYRLRAYHNPENVPFSAIPPGWRFLYADEFRAALQKPIRIWFDGPQRFNHDAHWSQPIKSWTYIVPINA